MRNENGVDAIDGDDIDDIDSRLFGAELTGTYGVLGQDLRRERVKRSRPAA